MPNWCQNECTFSGPSDQIKELFDLITTDDHTQITFNKLVPMPAIIDKIQRGGTIINGTRVDRWMEDPDPDGKPVKRLLTPEEEAELQRIGFKDWWGWRIAKWGCKWDASESQVNEPDLSSDTSDFFASFLTPWGPPDEFYIVLRERFPGVHMTLFWNEPGVEGAGYL